MYFSVELRKPEHVALYGRNNYIAVGPKTFNKRCIKKISYKTILERFNNLDEDIFIYKKLFSSIEIKRKYLQSITFLFLLMSQYNI